jgi:hypothetical protein
MKKTLIVAAVLALSFSPMLAFAANQWSWTNLPSVWNISVLQGPLVTCTGDITGLNPTSGGPTNPCQSLCDLILTIVVDIYIAIAFVIWIILPIMIIVGGIMYMMGGADPGLLTTAKSTLKGAIIGVIIVLCAYLLVATFVKFMTITNIGGFSSNSPSVCTPPPGSQ